MKKDDRNKRKKMLKAKSKLPAADGNKAKQKAKMSLGARLAILIPVLVIFLAGITALMVFLCTMSVYKVNYVDETGETFKTKKVITSIYNKNMTAPEVIGYNFVSWDGSETNEKTIEAYQSKQKTYVVHYETEVFEMPILKIITSDNEKINSTETYTKSVVSLMNAGEGEFSQANAGTKLKENADSKQKLPYQLRFDSKRNLLGLHEGKEFKKWVLLDEWNDPSFSRTALNLFLAKKFGFYASDFGFVEVFINGDYKGVYLLCEEQEIDADRINIEEYLRGTTDELDTGFLFENSPYYSGEENVIENNNYGEVLKAYHWIIRSGNTKPEQVEYMRKYMQNVYDVLFSKTVSRAQIEKVIDVDSAVQMTILQLINGNYEMNSSFFAYRDKGGKLQFGAPLEASRVFGNMESARFSDGEYELNHLLAILFEKKWFSNLVYDKWKEFKTVQTDAINYLDNISKKYEKEFERNFKLYDTLGKKTNKGQVSEVKSFKSQKEASEYLSTWLEKRFEKIDDALYEIKNA